MDKVAIYPGTFDPITYGHLDVMQSAAAIFDKVVVGIGINSSKTPMFSAGVRLNMINKVLTTFDLDNVYATIFNGLAIEFARQEHAIAIIRGLRLVTDYEFELNISFNNRVLYPALQTVFIAPRQEHIHISSSVVRELLRFGSMDILSEYIPTGALEQVLAVTRIRS